MHKRIVSRLALSLLLAGILTGALGLAQDGPPIDINSADQKQLESLPGIGPALAKRILEHRQKNGPFKAPIDLLNVRGIGEKKFQALKDRITVGQNNQQKPKTGTS